MERDTVNSNASLKDHDIGVVHIKFGQDRPCWRACLEADNSIRLNYNARNERFRPSTLSGYPGLSITRRSFEIRVLQRSSVEVVFHSIQHVSTSPSHICVHQCFETKKSVADFCANFSACEFSLLDQNIHNLWSLYGFV